MDINLAKDIREAFDWCSLLFECFNAEGVLEDFENSDLTVAQWVHLRLECESVWAERNECYAEWKKNRPEIVKRLKLIGITPRRNRYS
jgi:hypothetical protein